MLAEGSPNPPLSLWSLFPGEELVTLTLGSGRGLEAALPRKPGSVTEGGCRGQGGVLGGGGYFLFPKPLPSPWDPFPPEAPPASGPSAGWAGTLTPGHLDELGDTEHAGGDEAFLEVSRVWNREKAGGQRAAAESGPFPSSSPHHRGRPGSPAGPLLRPHGSSTAS